MPRVLAAHTGLLVHCAAAPRRRGGALVASLQRHATLRRYVGTARHVHVVQLRLRVRLRRQTSMCVCACGLRGGALAAGSLASPRRIAKDPQLKIDDSSANKTK